MKKIKINFKQIDRNPKYSLQMNNKIGFYNNLRAKTTAAVDFYNSASPEEREMIYETVMSSVIKTAKWEKALNNIIGRKFN